MQVLRQSVQGGSREAVCHHGFRGQHRGAAGQPDTADPSGRKTHPYQRNLVVEEAVRDVTPSGNYALAWTFHLPADTAGQKDAGMPDSVQLMVEITPQGRILSIGGGDPAFLDPMSLRRVLTVVAAASAGAVAGCTPSPSAAPR